MGDLSPHTSARNIRRCSAARWSSWRRHWCRRWRPATRGPSWTPGGRGRCPAPRSRHVRPILTLNLARPSPRHDYSTSASVPAHDASLSCNDASCAGILIDYVSVRAAQPQSRWLCMLRRASTFLTRYHHGVTAGRCHSHRAPNKSCSLLFVSSDPAQIAVAAPESLPNHVATSWAGSVGCVASTPT